MEGYRSLGAMLQCCIARPPLLVQSKPESPCQWPFCSAVLTGPAEQLPAQPEMASEGVPMDPPTGARNIVTVSVYPYETSTSTVVSETTVRMRKFPTVRFEVVGEDSSKPKPHQKIVHHYRIDLEELSPESCESGPDQEFVLQIARDAPACALTSCGSLELSHVQSHKQKGQYLGWKRLLSVLAEKEICSEDGGPNFRCKFGDVSVNPSDRSLGSSKRAKLEHSSSGEESSSDEEEHSSSSESDMGHGPLVLKHPHKSPKRITSAPVTIMVSVCLERRFSDRKWDQYKCSQGPEPKSSLLMDGETSGDVSLITKVPKTYSFDPLIMRTDRLCLLKYLTH